MSQGVSDGETPVLSQALSLAAAVELQAKLVEKKGGAPGGWVLILIAGTNL